MTLFLSLVIIILAVTIAYLSWVVRSRYRGPAARLEHKLKEAGLAPGDSITSPIEEASRHLTALLARAQRSEATLDLLQSILERTQDGIMVVDEGLHVVLANPAAGRIFGQPQSHLGGRRLTELTREKHVYDGFRAAIKHRRSFEGKIERIEGIERQVFQMRIMPLANKQAAGVFMDVTRLERLERVRQEFLSSVSHELRTPLTAILAYVETLLDGGIDDSENNLRFLEIIQKHAQRLNSLVDDIADLSAIESGHVHLTPASLNMRELVRDVMEMLRPRARQYEVELVIEIPPSLVITADRKRFEQVLLNLVDNAVKFNRRGGEVRVQAKRQDCATAISVIDTGIGIPPSDLPRVFERFYRVDKARSVELGGTGLGLAIVKHLVRIQGGRITVESVPGKGTCFTIIWPDPSPHASVEGLS